MSAEKNYQELLENVCEKLNNIESVNESDVTDIKKSVESIEKLISTTQAKVNFQEIKEKLENIAFQVDATNDTILKDLYNDINSLKTSTNSVNQHLDNLQNVQNMALTRAEFDEFQKQQLDLALKSNENIFSELKAIKESTGISGSGSDSQSIRNLENQLDMLHGALTKYLDEIAGNIKDTPNIDDISSVVTDLNSVQSKNIKQTNVLIKEVQAQLLKFHSEFQSKDFMRQIDKISEIYDSLDVITSWVERVGYINQSIENVYARLGENIDFDDVSEKVDIIYESISTLNNWTMKIDKLDTSIPELHSKLGSLSTVMGDTKNIINTLNSLKERMDTTFSEELDFDDLSNKMDIVYENLSALNQWANKLDTVSEKVNEDSQNLNTVKENVNGVSDTINGLSDKVNIISDNVDTVSGNIRSISEDINVLSDKVNGVSDKTSGLESISGKVDDVLNSVIAFSENGGAISGEIEKVSEKVNDVVNNLVSVSEQNGEISKEVENVSAKVNDVVNNIVSVSEQNSEISKEVEKVSGKVSDVVNNMVSVSEQNGEISKEVEKVSGKVSDVVNNMVSVSEQNGEISKEVERVSSKIDNVSAKVDNVSGKIDDVLNSVVSVNEEASAITGELERISGKAEDIVYSVSGVSDSVKDVDEKVLNVNEAVDTVSENIENVSEKVNEIFGGITAVSDSLADVDDHVKNVSNGVTSVNEAVNNFSDLITNKIDIIYDNIGLLNQWVNKIDNIAQQGRALDEKYTVANDNLNGKIDEINRTLYKASGIIDGVPDLKDRLEDLSNELHTITRTTKNDTESYIYTLLDIESDFLKLHKFLDDTTQMTSNDIKALKERFSELNDDITSISIRTNKLILSADDANKEFRTCLDSFRNAIKALDEKTDEFNPEFKYGLLDSKIGEIIALLRNTTNAAENLNKAFAYLGDWIDATGNILNDMQKDVSGIEEIKNQSAELYDRFNGTLAISLENSTGKILETVVGNSENSTEKIIETVIANSENSTEKITESIIANSENTLDKIKQCSLVLEDEIKNNALNLNRLVIGVEKAFKDFKEDDIKAMKDAMTFLVDRAEDFDLKASLDKIEYAVENNGAHDITVIKDATATALTKLSALENTFSDFRNDEFSDIKSSLTGIMVQLNTALTPHIDSLNERIDKLAELNSGSLSELETLMQEKISQQSKQIAALEEKIEVMNIKFDKLYEAVTDSAYNTEIKDILNYIATQIATANENLALQQNNQQNNTEVLANVAESVANFDESITKLVSYIEE